MSIPVHLSDTVQSLCDAFADGLRAVLGSKLHALLLCGAAVFPETQGTGDVDLHAIIKSELTTTEREGIRSLQRRLAERFPPLGEELDAYVILLAEARQSGFPVHQLDTSIVDELGPFTAPTGSLAGAWCCTALSLRPSLRSRPGKNSIAHSKGR